METSKLEKISKSYEIGIEFVFQNYNLTSHQNMLQHVEISLTLSGNSESTGFIP